MDLPKLRECAFIDIFASSPLLKVQNASILKVKIDEQRMKSENSTAVIASSRDLESAYSRVCVLVVVGGLVFVGVVGFGWWGVVWFGCCWWRGWGGGWWVGGCYF